MFNIISFETIDSTNSYAKSSIENLADKTVISTDRQTAGRGRFTRSWVDLGSENIYMTIVLKPSDKFSEVYANLTQYLSFITCLEFEKLGLSPKIKWPNDILLNNKKAVGILAETVFKGGQLKGIVLGIGINLNANQENLNEIDRPATAVNIELGKNVNKQEFMQNVLENFFAGYDDFLINGFKSIKEEYVNRSNFLNQNLNVAVFDKIKTGYAKDLSDNGELILINENGEAETINMGEIV